MPRKGKQPVAPHSSEIDELADDPALQPSPPDPSRLAKPRARSSKAKPKVSSAPIRRTNSSIKPSLSRKGESVDLDGVSGVRSDPATALDRFRYRGPHPKPFSELVTASEDAEPGASTTAAATANHKRPRPPKELYDDLVQPLEKCVRSSMSKEPPAVPNARVEGGEEFVLAIPDFDSDGEPIFEPEDPAAAPIRPSPRIPADSAVSSPNRAHSCLPRSPSRSANRAMSPASPGRASRKARTPTHSSPIRPLPSSINLPDEVLARLQTRRSSPLSADPPAPAAAAAPRRSRTSSTLEQPTSSSPPAAPLGGPARVQAQLARSTRSHSSKGKGVVPPPAPAPATPEPAAAATGGTQVPLTVEQQRQVQMFVREMEELEGEAFEAFGETLPGEVPGEEVDDPDDTLVDLIFDLPSPVKASAGTDAPHEPEPPAHHVASGDCNRSQFQQQQQQGLSASADGDAIARRSSSPTVAPARPSAEAPTSRWGATFLDKFQRAPNPPPALPKPKAPASYRLVPLSIEGVISHLRAVASSPAGSAGARADEVQYLRGEVTRLAGELALRDEAIGAMSRSLRAADERVGRAEEREAALREREGEWGEERERCRAKVDVLREVRRGLLGEVAELRARVDDLEGQDARRSSSPEVRAENDEGHGTEVDELDEGDHGKVEGKVSAQDVDEDKGAETAFETV
ncbi:uncharacterized protein JCM10292_003102 [Rhodotorula paludigena]|uniref:uncharacterized protein n=1 Tax=Rhodotorula paludigena TaxID=86838 RepID=UPI0031806F9D